MTTRNSSSRSEERQSEEEITRLSDRLGKKVEDAFEGELPRLEATLKQSKVSVTEENVMAMLKAYVEYRKDPGSQGP